MSNQDKLSDICDLFNKYGSDKDRNGYLQVYHSLFHRIRTDIVTVLEIGSSTPTFSSLSALRDYFVSGRVISISSSLAESTDETRIETFLCNSTKKNDVEAFITELGAKATVQDENFPIQSGFKETKFDIIIDNGPHNDMDQISTMRNFYPYLSDDGIYIIEGIGTDNKLSQCPSLIGCLCNHDPYFFAGIKNSMCVVQKHHLNSRRKLY